MNGDSGVSLLSEEVVHSEAAKPGSLLLKSDQKRGRGDRGSRHLTLRREFFSLGRLLHPESCAANTRTRAPHIPKSILHATDILMLGQRLSLGSAEHHIYRISVAYNIDLESLLMLGQRLWLSRAPYLCQQVSDIDTAWIASLTLSGAGSDCLLVSIR